VVAVVAPGKIFFLFLARAAAKIPVLSMSFTFPSSVKNYFVVIPNVVIVVVAVMNTVTGAYACSAAGDDYG